MHNGFILENQIIFGKNCTSQIFLFFKKYLNEFSKIVKMLTKISEN